MSRSRIPLPLAAGAVGVLAGAALLGVAQAAPPGPPDYGFGRTETCVLDAASSCTIQHGLGVRPTAVTVTHGGYNGIASVDPATITTTTYRYVVYRNDGQKFAAGIRAYWNVHFDLPAGATPPPTTSPPPTATPSPTPPPTATTEPPPPGETTPPADPPPGG